MKTAAAAAPVAETAAPAAAKETPVNRILAAAAKAGLTAIKATASRIRGGTDLTIEPGAMPLGEVVLLISRIIQEAGQKSDCISAFQSTCAPCVVVLNINAPTPAK